MMNIIHSLCVEETSFLFIEENHNRGMKKEKMEWEEYHSIIDAHSVERAIPLSTKDQSAMSARYGRGALLIG